MYYRPKSFTWAVPCEITIRIKTAEEGIMDIQLKRGILDVCVLTAIKGEDSYGYKIIKDVKPYIELTESTLYTILKRLECAGMLTVRTAEHGGRIRKYYHITEAGLRRIDEFKEEWREVMSLYSYIVESDGKHRGDTGDD